MKRTIAALIWLATMPILISSPGRAADTAAAPPSPALVRIKESGVLRVGMSGDQPPLNMRTKKDGIVGLDVDLATMLAESMNAKPGFVLKPFSELLPALRAGEVDVVISGVTITPERNLTVAFVGPYYVSGKSILTTSDTLKKLDDATQLDKSSIRLAALAGSTSQIFVEELMPKAKLVKVATYDEGVKMVKNGKVDALVADYPFCAVAVLRDESDELETLAEPLTFEPLGIALPPDDPLFVNLVSNFLNTLEGTGALHKLGGRWFADGSWLDKLP